MQPNTLPDMQCTMLIKKNADVGGGDKPVKNDATDMSLSEDAKQKAW